GYAKFTGGLGVCMATSGPGAIHLLNGLYDAKLDHQPVVALIGQTNRTAMGGSYQQEVDLLSLYKDVASEYVQVVMAPEQLPNVLDRAIRTALSERAPTAIIVPLDVQEMDYSPPTHDFKMVPSSVGISRPEVVADHDAIQRAAAILNEVEKVASLVPLVVREMDYSPPTHDFKMVPSSVGISRPEVVADHDAIQRAAAILNEGEKVAILVGAGARGARDELIAVADLLGAGIAKA